MNYLCSMKNKKKPFEEQLGIYLIDISKLTFGGVVLSVILDISHNKPLVLAVGIIATFGVAIWGFILVNFKNEKS
jgi:hypothetical protein